jgi:hypothetical protein
MTHHKVTCDVCEADLTYHGKKEYRYELSCAKLPFPPEANTGYETSRPFRGTAHFCSKICLVKWVAENVPDHW